MPGFVPSPETVRVNLHWSIHGRPQLNVLHGHFATVGPVNPASAQNIRNAIATALSPTSWLRNLSATTTFDQVGVVDLRNSSVPEVLSTGTPIPGIDTFNAMPDQVAFVVTLRTNMTGRSHRGRVYLLGMATDIMTTDGQVQPAVATDAVAFVNAVKAAMATEGMPLAIRSPALPSRPSKPGGTLDPKPFEITEVSLVEARDHFPDTNRRRTDRLRR